MGMRIKKGDRVVILAGRDKGKSGQVLKVMPSKGRAIVEGVNLVKKHMRRRSEAEQGGIKEIPSSVRIANLNLFCSHCNRPVRFQAKILEDKTKIRVCTRCSKPI